MASRNEMMENMRGFSIAMYSTWTWHQSIRSLFDAGEGVSPHMRNHVFAVENVFLTHGHHDHTGGVPGLAFARGSARGDKEKPFTVYHPAGWSKIAALKDYVASSSMGYELRWMEVEPKQDIPVGVNVFVRPFRVEHSRHAPCLGYSVVERRQRLRRDLVGKSGAEIAAISRSEGADSVRETYEKVVMAYSGDCSALDTAAIEGADVLIHEATFVGEAEMDPAGGHSTVRQAVATAELVEAGTLVLCHLSYRHTTEQAIAEARKAMKEIGFDKPVYLLAGPKMFQVG